MDISKDASEFERARVLTTERIKFYENEIEILSNKGNLIELEPFMLCLARDRLEVWNQILESYKQCKL